jgi:small subunit ribosomal protein S17e
MGCKQSFSLGGKKMGKVRTVLIKRLARELVDRYSENLSTDFEQNKELVDELLSNTTKRLRNRIAGYVTHLMKLREVEEVT